MSEVSKDLRNIFLSPKPPILKVEVGIFSDQKSFSQIFQIIKYLSYLNFISVNLKKNLRTFFSRKKVPATHKGFDFFFQKFQLEVGIFSDKKSFSQIFQMGKYLSYLNFISVKLKKNRRTFFGHKNPRFWNLKLDFFPVRIFSNFFFQIGKYLSYLN